MKTTIEITKYDATDTRSDIQLLIEPETELEKSLINELDKNQGQLSYSNSGSIRILLEFNDILEDVKGKNKDG